MTDYVNSHYKAHRIVLAGAGGVDHDKLCSLAEKYLGNLSMSYENSAFGVPTMPPTSFTGSEVCVHRKHQTSLRPQSVASRAIPSLRI